MAALPKIPAGLVLFGLVALLVGCGGSPAVRYYALADGEPAVPTTAVVPGPGVVIGPVSVPERVDRPAMVRIEDRSQVTVADGHRWIAPIKAELASRVARAVAREAGWSQVVASPQASLVAPRFSVPIDVTGLETHGFQKVTLEAVWSVRQGAAVLAEGRFAASEPVVGGDYAGVAAAHARLADALARDIATRLPGR
ncbi:MAG: membrane integrity-associated transporter subunit PqiC [Zoogloeaceae bacterium]|nr:membrane integrity-associated transporter subunit PqiC [Zoogloeaceae bacterium]